MLCDQLEVPQDLRLTDVGVERPGDDDAVDPVGHQASIPSSTRGVVGSTMPTRSGSSFFSAARVSTTVADSPGVR